MSIRSRFPPKYHRKKAVTLGSAQSFDGCTAKELINAIENAAQKVQDPRIEVDAWDEHAEMFVTGFIPMTEKEKVAVDKRNAKSKEAKKRAKLIAEGKEKALLKRLAKQYPDVVLDLDEG